MLLLALDTSTEICSAALWRDGEVRERAFPTVQAHGELLLPMVQELLTDSGLRLAQLDGLAVAGGPGSFTGLRIACGVAQGLAFGASLPLATVGSLLALAEASGAEHVLSCLDARMQEVYWAAYARDGASWREVSSPAVTAPGQLSLPTSSQWEGLGSGFAAYPEVASRLAPQLSLRPDLRPALAGAVARLAAARWTELAAPPQQAQPMYVRNKVALTTAERAREGWR